MRVVLLLLVEIQIHFHIFHSFRIVNGLNGEKHDESLQHSKMMKLTCLYITSFGFLSSVFHTWVERLKRYDE